MKEITLHEFIAEMEVLVRRFREQWIERNAAEPDKWPMSMPAGEWDEQFMIYDGNGL